MLKTAFFYLFFISIIVCSIVGLFRYPLYVVSVDLAAFHFIDTQKYNSITLGLEPYRGVMLAMNFLGKTRLYSIEDSYFPKIEFNPERITNINPLLTSLDSCWANSTIDSVKLSDNLILITGLKQNDFQIESVTGAYDRETDGKNWWHWVEHKVRLKIQTQSAPEEAAKTRLRFEYGTRGNQKLTLNIITHDGAGQEILIQGKGSGYELFDKVVDIDPSTIAEVVLETDGIASPLGKHDPRIAAWIIRNAKITSIPP